MGLSKAELYVVCSAVAAAAAAAGAATIDFR